MNRNHNVMLSIRTIFRHINSIVLSHVYFWWRNFPQHFSLYTCFLSIQHFRLSALSVILLCDMRTSLELKSFFATTTTTIDAFHDAESNSPPRRQNTSTMYHIYKRFEMQEIFIIIIYMVAFSIEFRTPPDLFG